MICEDVSRRGSAGPNNGKDVEDDNCVYHKSLFANVIVKKKSKKKVKPCRK